MKNEVCYFPHDGNARNDEKLLDVRMKYGMEGYGIYFAILERLRISAQYMCVKNYNMIAFDLRVSADKIKSIVEDFGLFHFANGGELLYSESFNERMKPLDNIREQRRLAGLKSAENRAVQRPFNDRSTVVDEKTNKEKKRKEKKSKINIEEGDTSQNEVYASSKNEIKIQTKNEIKKEKSCSKKESATFVKPTLEQVVEFCSERKNSIDAEKFLNYYTANGWRVGKNPMKNWQAAVRSWEKNNFEKQNEHGKQARVIGAIYTPAASENGYTTTI